jgi:hypothetical protein
VALGAGGRPGRLSGLRRADAVSRFIELVQEAWVAAPPEIARSHWADLDHRRVARVHPDERLRLLPPGPAGPRYERLARRGWGLVRDVFERELRSDGGITDLCVAGADWGRRLHARFFRHDQPGVVGTMVELTVTQPLRPVAGRFLAHWLRGRLEREVAQMLAEHKRDVEQGWQAQQRHHAA